MYHPHRGEPSVFTTAAYQATAPNEIQSMYTQDSASPGKEPDSYIPEREPKRSIFLTGFAQLFSLAWVVPAMTLLVLNYKEHIIGASAWCPHGTCWVQANDNVTSVPQQRMAHFDRTSHNLLGTLQVVAKVMEIWFAFIAAGLLYLVIMRRACRPGGLPIRYITLPAEFTDTLRMLDHKLWRSLTTARHTHTHMYKSRFGLYIVILSTVLCILCNLMGPAIAVLVIPGLQWVDTAEHKTDWFRGYSTDAQPRTDGWAWNDNECTAAEFESLEYSCARQWARTLDTWVASSATSIMESPSGSLLAKMTQQRDVYLTVNTTVSFADRRLSSQMLWVPSRQLVNGFNNDSYIIAGISLAKNASELEVLPSDYASYIAYNKSLQLGVQRYGPILGAYPNLNGNGWWTTDINAEKSIMCFSKYTLMFPVDGTADFTKCIQVTTQGVGWGGNTASSPLIAVDRLNKSAINDLRVGHQLNMMIHASDRAVLLPNGDLEPDYEDVDGTVHRHQPECIGPLADGATVEGLGYECDWDHFFGDSYNAFSTWNSTTDVTTFRYWYGDLNVNDTVGLVVDLNVFGDFTWYSFDPLWLTNPLRLVETPSLPEIGRPLPSLPVHPSWWLAALSLDWNNAVLPPNRTVSQMLFRMMDYLQTSDLSTLPTKSDTAAVFAAIQIPIFQTLSLIDYIHTPERDPDPFYESWPQFTRKARMQVWTYGLYSRTTYLGVTIVSVGIIAVLWQFVLGLTDRRQIKSLTQTVVAALAHAPHNDFYARSGDEMKVAGTRFKIVDDGTRPGKLRFETPG